MVAVDAGRKKGEGEEGLTGGLGLAVGGRVREGRARWVGPRGRDGPRGKKMGNGSRKMGFDPKEEIEFLIYFQISENTTN